MAGGDPKAMDRFWGIEVALALSFTVTLNDTVLPVALVGVPLIRPLAVFKSNPAGRAPVLTVQAPYGGIPSAADSCAE